MGIKRVFREASRTEEKGSKTYRSVWSLQDDGREILSVEELAEDKKVTVGLNGTLRSDTQFFFKDELFALATVDCDVTLDCESLLGISNACQKALIEAQQMMDNLGRGTLTLVKLPGHINDDFRASGLAGALEIE